MPVFGLAAFVVLPPAQATAAYLVILGASVLIYKAIIDAMRRRVVTGLEAMLGGLASVRRVESRRLVVCLRGELWTARPAGFANGAPQPGEQVVVREIRGNRLIVGPLPGESSG